MKNKSVQLFQAALRHIPGGVNSPVRAFGSVGGSPVFVKKGKGAFIWDENGKRYLDFMMSWGPMILGHAHDNVVRAIQKQSSIGMSFGAPTANEIELAELIKEAFPSIEKVRLVSSGTEAVMSAIRLARGVTKRKRIVKIDGGYHGHADSLLVQAGSGILTFGVPNSAGVPDEVSRLTFSVPYNDERALEALFKKYGSEIAAFIIEPVCANMGWILPKNGYLKKVRSLCTKYGILLIFDEVVTGFRIAFGGAQECFDVGADLTCLGKILGGGMPIGAFGGKKRFMDQLAPEGPVYQAGTLSGNPLATAAGIATLKVLRQENFYRLLSNKSAHFFQILKSGLSKWSERLSLSSFASGFTLFFASGPLSHYREVRRCNTQLYAAFFHQCLKKGIYFAPSQFETNFISAAHSKRDLEKAAETILQILNRLMADRKSLI